MKLPVLVFVFFFNLLVDLLKLNKIRELRFKKERILWFTHVHLNRNFFLNTERVSFNCAHSVYFHDAWLPCECAYLKNEKGHSNYNGLPL